jgi:hypothetical protein
MIKSDSKLLLQCTIPDASAAYAAMKPLLRPMSLTIPMPFGTLHLMHIIIQYHGMERSGGESKK